MLYYGKLNVSLCFNLNIMSNDHIIPGDMVQIGYDAYYYYFRHSQEL